MSRNRREPKIKLDLSMNVLDIMINTFFCENNLINKKLFYKIRELIKMLDKTPFESDRNMMARIFLIEKLLEGYLDKHLVDPGTLSDYALGGQYDDIIWGIYDEINNTADLSNEEIYFIDEYISDRLQYAYIYEYSDKIDEMLLKLNSGDFNSLSSFNEEFEDVISALYNKMKQTKVMSAHTARDFTTEIDSIDIALSKTMSNIKSPSSIIKSGIKWFNRMLNGGFHAGRVYLFLALPKGGKSTLLLNIALWAKKYNKGIKTKDPTKKPCVVYLTMENSIDETIERIWSHYFGDDDEMDIRNFTTEEVIQMLNEKGFIDQDEDDIAIKIIYRPNRSITTADMDAILEDLELDGYECIMLIQDYIKRIRSVEKAKELRIELGDIANEMCTIAKDRQIPIITASQLNRDAARIFENALANKKQDVFKLLGSSHIGESALMIENVDAVFILGREKKESTGTTYLVIKNIAARYKIND